MSRPAGDKSARMTTEPGKHIPLQVQTCPAARAVWALPAPRCSPEEANGGAHTPCLLTVGSPNSSRHVQSHARTKSRSPMITREQRGGAEASTRKAFCTRWRHLHTALTTGTWVVPCSAQGTWKHLFVLGSLATGQGYLFFDQASFLGQGYLIYTRPATIS